MEVWSLSFPTYNRILHKYSWFSIFYLSPLITSVFLGRFALISIVFDHIVLLVTSIGIVILLLLSPFVFHINFYFSIGTWLFNVRGSLNNRSYFLNPVVFKYAFKSRLGYRGWRSLLVANRWLTASIFSDDVRQGILYSFFIEVSFRLRSRGIAGIVFEKLRVVRGEKFIREQVVYTLHNVVC